MVQNGSCEGTWNGLFEEWEFCSFEKSWRESTPMPSGPNSGQPGPWSQGWRSHPKGLALTLGARCLAFAGHGKLERLRTNFWSWTLVIQSQIQF